MGFKMGRFSLGVGLTRSDIWNKTKYKKFFFFFLVLFFSKFESNGQEEEFLHYDLSGEKKKQVSISLVCLAPAYWIVCMYFCIPGTGIMAFP